MAPATQPPNGLATILTRFCREIASAVAEARKNGEIVDTRATKIRTVVTEFSYRDEGSVQHTSTLEQEVEDEWHWRDQFRFLDKVVKQLPAYGEVLAAISGEFPQRGAPEFVVTRFAQLVAAEAGTSRNGALSDEQIIEQVVALLDDLNRNAIRWNANVWLNGIWLRDETVAIDERTVLRRPRADDLEERVDIERALWGMRDRRSFDGLPSAILEFHLKTIDGGAVQRHVAQLLDALRLFRVGCVAYIRLALSNRSIERVAGVFSPGSIAAQDQKYPIAAADSASLGAYVARLLPALPVDPAYATTAATEVTPIGVALVRYRDGLLQLVTAEARIASVMSCLEALYQKAQERTELTHRLSQRVAALMRSYGYQPIKVYREIGEAYDVRSTFIHGSAIPREKYARCSELLKAVLEYARVSMNVFVQLPSDTDREGFVSQLDNSLLEPKAAQRIEELLKTMLVPVP